MKRTSRLALLICGSLTPLFSGCGGCGGTPSIAQQQAARAARAAAEEEIEEPAPPPTAPVQAAPEEEPPSAPTEPAAKPTLAGQPAATVPPAENPVPVEPTPPPVQPPAAAPVASATPALNPEPPESAAPSTSSTTAAATPPPATIAPTPVQPPAFVPAVDTDPAPTPSAVASPDQPSPVGPMVQVASASEMRLPERTLAPDASSVSLLPQAKKFAAASEETEADRMLLGEAMLRDRLEEWPFAMRWSPALRRPVPWIRTGIGFYVDAVDVRGNMAPIPAKDLALERDFGAMGRNVLDLGGELAEKSLAAHLTLLRAGKLGPTLAPLASGPVDAGRPLPTRLCGGLLLFGPGEPRLLKAHAERLGLDLLIVYDVRAKRNVDDPAQPINDTAIKLIDVVGDREIFATKLLRNLEVAATRKNPVAPDPVDPVTTEVQAFVDSQLPLTDFPAEVRPEHVRARLPKLIDQALASKNALPYLVEIKALHLHGYLAGLEARDAYAAILGESEGQALYDGTPEERLVALERLLPRLQSAATSVDTASVSD